MQQVVQDGWGRREKCKCTCCLSALRWVHHKMQVGIIFLFAKLQDGDVKVTSRFAVIKKEMVFMLHLVRRQIHEGCSLLQK